MTALEANARSARNRLTMNTWFATTGWCLIGACGVWIVLVVVDKLLGWQLPTVTAALGLAGAAVLTASVWAWWARHSLVAAAVALDEAADLKERTATGLLCRASASDDPFVHAAVADAERINGRLSARSFIRLRWPPSLSLAAVAVVVAVAVTLLPIGPLGTEPALAGGPTPELARQEVRRAQRHIDQLREQVDKSPQLNELKTKLQSLEDLPIENLQQPDRVQREAARKIDQFTADVRKQLADDQSRMNEMKQMFRQLKTAEQPHHPTDKLAHALARGDYNTAQEAVRQMQEQLARMGEDADPAMQDEMRKKMDELAQRIKDAAKQDQRKEQLQKDLEAAGVDAETAKRALENLTKKDLDAVRKQMEEQGADEQKVRDMQRQMQASNKAGAQGDKLAQAAQQAAEAMQGQGGAMSEAGDALQDLADQLNGMEQMSQQISEMESLLDSAQQAMNDLSQSSCSQCNGKGCSSCDGTGQGKGQGQGQAGSGQGGQMGQGRGGRGAEEQTATRWQRERTPVITTQGAIISKMFIDGEQVKGEVASEAAELLTAAERAATDAIDGNRIPAQYNAAIKRYYSRMRRAVSGAEDDAPVDDGAAADGDDD